MSDLLFETAYAHAVSKGFINDARKKTEQTAEDYYNSLTRYRFGPKRYGVFPDDRVQTAKRDIKVRSYRRRDGTLVNSYSREGQESEEDKKKERNKKLVMTGAGVGLAVGAGLVLLNFRGRRNLPGIKTFTFTGRSRMFGGESFDEMFGEMRAMSREMAADGFPEDMFTLSKTLDVPYERSLGPMDDLSKWVVFEPEAFRHLEGRNYDETLGNVERWLRGKPIEHAVVINRETGKVMLGTRGNELQAPLLFPELMPTEMRRKMTVTHNHPHDMYLSGGDIGGMIAGDFPEMRAVQPNGTVTRMTIDYDSLDLDYDDFDLPPGHPMAHFEELMEDAGGYTMGFFEKYLTADEFTAFSEQADVSDALNRVTNNPRIRDEYNNTMRYLYERFSRGLNGFARFEVFENFVKGLVSTMSNMPEVLATHISKKFRDRHGIYRDENGQFADAPGGTALSNPENQKLAYERASQLIANDPGYQREREEQRQQARLERSEQRETGYVSREERKDKRKLTKEERKKLYVAASVVAGLVTLGLTYRHIKGRNEQYKKLREVAEQGFGKQRTKHLSTLAEDIMESSDLRMKGNLTDAQKSNAAKSLSKALQDAFDNNIDFSWTENKSSLQEFFYAGTKGSRTRKPMNKATFESVSKPFEKGAVRVVRNIPNPTRDLPDRFNPFDHKVREFNRTMRSASTPGSKEFRAAERKARRENLRSRAGIFATAAAGETLRQRGNEADPKKTSSTSELRDLSGWTGHRQVAEAKAAETSTEPEKVNPEAKTNNVSQEPEASGVPAEAVKEPSEKTPEPETPSEPKAPPAAQKTPPKNAAPVFDALVHEGVQAPDGRIIPAEARDYVQRIDNAARGLEPELKVGRDGTYENVPMRRQQALAEDMGFNDWAELQAARRLLIKESAK